MFLYSRNNDKIEVFKLEPKPDEIKEYKISELEKNRPKIYTHYSYGYPEPFSSDFLSDRGDRPFEEKDINSIPGDYEIRNYLIEDKNADLDSFIAKYGEMRWYNWNGTPLVTKNNSNEILYRLLLTEPYYINNTMKGIVDLPESIYLLHLLEKEEITKLLNEEISEQLKLFSLNHYDKLSIDEYRRSCDCMLTPGCYGANMHKVYNTEKILAKIK